MSNQHPKFLLKMSSRLHSVFNSFINAVHPAAGRAIAEKKKKRTSTTFALPKGSPDSLNIRDIFKSQNSIRRNPAP